MLPPVQILAYNVDMCMCKQGDMLWVWLYYNI